MIVSFSILHQKERRGEASSGDLLRCWPIHRRVVITVVFCIHICCHRLTLPERTAKLPDRNPRYWRSMYTGLGYCITKAKYARKQRCHAPSEPTKSNTQDAYDIEALMNCWRRWLMRQPRAALQPPAKMLRLCIDTRIARNWFNDGIHKHLNTAWLNIYKRYKWGGIVFYHLYSLSSLKTPFCPSGSSLLLHKSVNFSLRKLFVKWIRIE